MYRRSLVRNFGTSCIATRDPSEEDRRFCNDRIKRKGKKIRTLRGETLRGCLAALLWCFSSLILISSHHARPHPWSLALRLVFQPLAAAQNPTRSRGAHPPAAAVGNAIAVHRERFSNFFSANVPTKQPITHLFLPRLRHSNTTSRFNRYINPFVVKRRFVFHKSRKFIWKTAGTSKVKLLDSAWEG